MSLKEDCVHFEYTHREVYGLGSREPEVIVPMPKCHMNRIAVGGCPSDCKDYVSR